MRLFGNHGTVVGTAVVEGTVNVAVAGTPGRDCSAVLARFVGKYIRNAHFPMQHPTYYAWPQDRSEINRGRKQTCFARQVAADVPPFDRARRYAESRGP